MKAHGTVGSAEHYTPEWLVGITRGLLGGIDLDPASCELANAMVQAETYYDSEMDGLSLPWFGRVFLNPPGGKTRKAQKFWAKLAEEYEEGAVEAACFVSFSLDFIQTTQRHSRGGVLAFPTWIPDRRFGYWSEAGEFKGGPRPSALTWLPPKDLAHGHAMASLQEAVKAAPMPGVIARGW